MDETKRNVLLSKVSTPLNVPIHTISIYFTINTVFSKTLKQEKKELNICFYEKNIFQKRYVYT